jgi:ureidoglycolate hydrolase
MKPFKITKQLQTQLITPNNFQPYGQVIFPVENEKVFDQRDAQLTLDQGIPRFYIMHLSYKGTKFHTINRHLQCTQCLGSLEGKEWLIAVCLSNNSTNIPDSKSIHAFHIPGNCFIKLNVGTWHAGPYFEYDNMNFYNLELSNTNITDNLIHNFLDSQNLEFEFLAPK